MVDFQADGECLLPRSAGGRVVSNGVLVVAEVDQRLGLVVAGTEVPAELGRLFVAGGGLDVVAEVMVGEAEAVPNGGFHPAVAEPLDEFERPLAGRSGLVIFAELPMAPADRVQGVGLADWMIDGLVQVEGLPGMVECLPMAALAFDFPAESQVGLCRASVGADGVEQLQGG